MMKNAFLLRLSNILLNQCRKSGSSNASSSIRFSQVHNRTSKRYGQFVCYSYISRKYASSSEHGDHKSTQESSSKSHQQNHRKSYERKRTNNTRQKHGNSNADAPSMHVTNDGMNHYQRLNVQPNADIETIKSAYYSLSKIYHPDMAEKTDENSANNFRLITESYGILSDSNQRAQYDLELKMNDESQMNDFSGIINNEINFNPIYRTRDADVIFRKRQEAAFEREKAANPRRYQAGTFKEEGSSEDSDKMSKVDRHLMYARSTSRGNSKDGSDFYRQHLIDSLERKRDDLRSHQSRAPIRSIDLSGLVLVFGVIVVFVIYTMSSLFLKIDIAEHLDTCIEKKLNESGKQDRSENTTSQK